MITRGEWTSQFALAYGELRCAFNRSNQLAIPAWMAGEREPEFALQGARNNPLSCTLYVPGSSLFNTAGVRNYETVDQGIHATILTLSQPTEGDYGPIREWMAPGSCGCAMLEAVWRSGWGTFAGWSLSEVFSLMESVVRTPATYLDAPVPGS